MADQFQLRDVFTPAVVDELAHNIQAVWPAFDADGFKNTINSQLLSLSFGDRNALIRDALAEHLPADFPTAAQILIEALGPELAEPELTGYDGFIIMPQADFIARYGLEHYEISMKALYEMTKRFTAEGAIRAFLEKYPAQTLDRLAEWVHDENCHVRRLVSEGTRPRLPLASRLYQFVDDPRPVLALLEHLKEDPVLLVRRSVANNLNDIAKDNPDLVVETLGRWRTIKDKGTQWIIKHALRTLIKQGHPGALALLGYAPNPAITVQNLRLTPTTVPLGEALEFSFTVESTGTETQNLMIDYVVYHMKANGKLAPKVFKLSKKTLQSGERLDLSKTHSFKPLSTRKYYPGQHRLEIQINGTRWAKAAFDLEIEATQNEEKPE